MREYPLTKSQFKKESSDFRIGAIISDGMWYSLSKWRKMAMVTEQELEDWIVREEPKGRLIRSATGARSYRFGLDGVWSWYDEHGIDHDQQVLKFLFPPRVWDGLTETEGFLSAPLREIGVVTVTCMPEVAAELTEELRGVGRVRETGENVYKVFALDSTFAKSIIEEVFARHPSDRAIKSYSRSVVRRRELVDFSEKFNEGLIIFYRDFGRSLIKSSMDTISIFLTEPEEQEAQMIVWVINAIEKFDQSASVPFSGYLDSVLKRWPYDLPGEHLGKELSDFQRARSKAIKNLGAKNEGRTDFTSREIAAEMGADKKVYVALEERHRVWLSSKNPTSFIWTEGGEEKTSDSLNDVSPTLVDHDLDLAAKLSAAIVDTALETGDFDSAWTVIESMDDTEIDPQLVERLRPTFVVALGERLGIE